MRRRRGLTEDEARLWAGVARQARPLPGRRLPEAAGSDPAEPAAAKPTRTGRRAEALAKALAEALAEALKEAVVLEAAEVPPAKSVQGRSGAARPATTSTPAGPARPSLMPAYQAPGQGKAGKPGSERPAFPTPSLPALHPIEKPVKRKLGAGRVAIEDRIDLHDKTQIVAHYALLAFLRGAQAQGLRHVLVITGRGASFGSRGVIKRSLAHWFGTPEFRMLVAGFEPAERQHGGDGAFYVRIRRR